MNDHFGWGCFIMGALTIFAIIVSLYLDDRDARRGRGK